MTTSRGSQPIHDDLREMMIRDLRSDVGAIDSEIFRLEEKIRQLKRDRIEVVFGLVQLGKGDEYLADAIRTQTADHEGKG